MNLLPYLRFAPHSQSELESRVPKGTVIPVYLFPDLKEGLRVQFIESANLAEAAHGRMMFVLYYGVPAMAALALLIFILVRVRRSFDEPAPRAYAAGA